MEERGKITKRAGIVGFFTLLSRIAGLIRDVAVAFFFGTSLAADAFYMAFTIPNLLRRFVAEGALTIAFIPIFSEYIKKNRDEAKELASLTFTYLLILLLIIMFLGILLAPWLVTLIAPGFDAIPEKYALTVQLTRFCFPYIVFVSLAALAMGILNSFKYFATPAAAPILFNVGFIIGALASPLFDPPVLGLTFGVLLGGMAQMGLQWAHLMRLHFMPKLKFGIHPAIWRLLGLMGPAAYGAAVYQLNVVIVRYFASYLPSGAVSYLWYADRIFEVPIGIFAISLATAIQPTLADQAAEKDWSAFRDTLAHGLHLNYLITIPAMVGLIVLAQPIVQVIFEHGIFTTVATQETASTLIAFAVGLPFLGAVRVLVPAYYALQDAKRPVLFATVAVATNFLGAYFFVTRLHHEGLALAISIASAVNMLLLQLYLKRYIGSWPWRLMLTVLFKVMIATGLMAGVLLGLQQIDWFASNSSFLWQVFRLAVLVAVGAGSFFGSAHLLRCKEVHELWTVIRRRRLPSQPQSN